MGWGSDREGYVSRGKRLMRTVASQSAHADKAGARALRGDNILGKNVLLKSKCRRNRNIAIRVLVGFEASPPLTCSTYHWTRRTRSSSNTYEVGNPPDSLAGRELHSHIPRVLLLPAPAQKSLSLTKEMRVDLLGPAQVMLLTQRT